jgi:SagB-type dehydrogenase family enzyme
VANRDPGPILAYHEDTKHSVASVRANRHFLDGDIMPRPFKVYPGLDPIPLPPDFASSRRPALAAIADAGTMVEQASSSPLDRTTLAHLLYFTAGVLRRKTYPGGEIFFRAAACTGALYHVDLYVVCGALPDLDAGVYHFAPHDFALRRLRSGDHRGALLAASGDEPALRGAPVVLVATSTFWRNAWKYQARTYRHCWWDAGTLLANLLALAAATALPARVVLGFADEPVNRLLDLDVRREVALCLVPLGDGGPAPPPSPAAPPLGLETLPLSAEEVEYPAIGTAHEASSLTSPEEAAAWRSSAPAPLSPPPGLDVVATPIEAVILRRGSARAFTDEPIDRTQLTTILGVATRGIPADAHAGVEPYLIVNAVDGMAPGTYFYDRRAGTLTLLRPGDFRYEAAHLGLGQDLPAQAAADVFWLVDLGPVVARLGSRGYRVAQLEAAIEGGKTYLAAYALGLGATGLTFFDDDVTAFFAPHAAGKSVMFLMAVGHTARRSQRS